MFLLKNFPQSNTIDHITINSILHSNILVPFFSRYFSPEAFCLPAPNCRTCWLGLSWPKSQDFSSPPCWQSCLSLCLADGANQETSSRSGKKYIKAVYCHPAYLTYTQSTSWEMLGWKKHKLVSSRPCFIRTLHHDQSILGGPTQHGSKFHWVRQGCGPCDEIG